ncbi:hypothetical protein P4C99_05475 [Pontiellaceae bacterium B1224]|nr:hypothetical protein [Pontiellaceae bacterium B1224]
MNRIRMSRRKHLGISTGFIATVLATGKAAAQEEFMTNLGGLKSSLVRIYGDKLIGIGFIGEQDGQQYVFTNASVISGHNKLSFKNLEDKVIAPKSIELSATRDLVRFMVTDENAIKLNYNIVPDEVISVLDYEKTAINSHGGVITGSSTDMVEINAAYKKSCSGGPLLDVTQSARGVVNHLVYYKADDRDWVGTPRLFAYKLDDADWYAARWSAYNRTYGKNLREIDEFRTAVYSVAQDWIDRPKEEIELTEPVGMEFDAWVKEYNGMISDLGKSYSKGNRGTAGEKLKKRFQESCQNLIDICQQKAEFLEFLCNDKNITKYLRIQFKWRSLELQKFCGFIKLHAKRHENVRWL